MTASTLIPPMTRPSRRELLIAGTLIVGEAITFARMPTVPVVAMPKGSGTLDENVPTNIGAWYDSGSGGLVLPPEQQARSDRVYSDVLARSYLNPAGAALMFLIAYDPTQSGMLQVHRPEACYPAAGFTLDKPRRIDVPVAPGHTVSALFITATNGPRIEQILYWTRIGREFPRSYDEQRSSVMSQNLRGLLPDGALIRLSIVDPDAEGSLAMMVRFAQQLYAVGNDRCRKMLVGPPVA
jgi:EpsI family protein